MAEVQEDQQLDQQKNEEEMPALEEQDDGGKKLNRGEKKCRKALMKLGMK